VYRDEFTGAINTLTASNIWKDIESPCPKLQRRASGGGGGGGGGVV
jgi:hypothetical protein